MRLYEGMEALLVARTWESRLRAEGVTLAQLSMLDSLIDEPLTMGALSDRERVAHSVMNGIVNRSLRLGLVRRERSPDDGRRVIVTATRKGEKLLNKLADLEV